MSFQKQKVINLYKELTEDCGEIKPYEWMRIRTAVYKELVHYTGVPRPSVRRIINEYRKEII
jgi:hypothetical protein